MCARPKHWSGGEVAPAQLDASGMLEKLIEMTSARAKRTYRVYTSDRDSDTKLVLRHSAAWFRLGSGARRYAD